eukprot:449108_1
MSSNEVDELTDSEDDENVTFRRYGCSINRCKSLKRLIKMLLFYHSSIDKDGNNLSLIEYFDTHITNLLNDYGHILCVHLDNALNQQNNDEFAVISAKCHKYINCSLNKCKYYQRNNRNRCKEEIKDSNDKLSLYVDIMDTIHCYFLHSYDTGFRIKQKKPANNDDSNTNDNNNTAVDTEMKYLYKEIQLKRKELQRVRGMERIKHTKFVLDIIGTDDEEDEKKENIGNVIDQDQDDTQYSFGRKFYYCDKDKNNEKEDKDEINGWYHHNRGYKIKDW